jgi:hypothetical protein
MECHFCWDETSDPQITREHLVSQPVANAFGIDRASRTFARFDATAVKAGNLDGLTWHALDDLRVRIACDRCNNGWMNDLEGAMKPVAKWVARGDTALGAKNYSTLRRWLLKTYIVLSVMEGGTRRFLSDSEDVGFAVMPEVTRAKHLRHSDEAAFDGVAIGLARTKAPTFRYGFGNPTVLPQGPGYASVRTAGVAVLTLGTLQAWVVVPFFSHASTRLPAGVRSLSPRIRANQLLTVADGIDLDAAVVNNGEHDINQLLDMMQVAGGEDPPT